MAIKLEHGARVERIPGGQILTPAQKSAPVISKKIAAGATHTVRTPGYYHVSSTATGTAVHIGDPAKIDGEVRIRGSVLLHGDGVLINGARSYDATGYENVTLVRDEDGGWQVFVGGAVAP